MIAPLQEKEDRPRSERLRHARGVVASTFFGKRSYSADEASLVSSWRAWLFTTWVMATAGACFAWLVGLF